MTSDKVVTDMHGSNHTYLGPSVSYYCNLKLNQTEWMITQETVLNDLATPVKQFVAINNTSNAIPQETPSGLSVLSE